MIIQLKCKQCERELLHSVETGEDIHLVCAGCGGAMQLIETIREKETVEVPVQPLPLRKPRDNDIGTWVYADTVSTNRIWFPGIIAERLYEDEYK